jgi:hypothetical protein
MMRERKSAGAVSDHSPFRNLTPLEWNPIFATRREDVTYALENKPLIEGRDLEESEDGVVRFFMKSKDESDACLPRAEKVEEYCFGATTLEALQAEKGEVGGPNSWLDERSSAGGKEQARQYRGLLTPQSLYRELRRPVSCTEMRSPTIPSHSRTRKLKTIADFLYQRFHIVRSAGASGGSKKATNHHPSSGSDETQSSDPELEPEAEPEPWKKKKKMKKMGKKKGKKRKSSSNLTTMQSIANPSTATEPEPEPDAERRKM